ncbi:hypothetical protein BKM03_08235 [Pseudomonas avellanae]|uniref:Uncharacterized protein n=1 Tax=Pseudomonas avellanae TaxID=46257 RepID=A0AAD0GPV3_9PSED|nr:hypothetical protein BKM03_08235 [Pseudomonas avellanae]POP85406.1 hypothetical protein CXB34_17675 [Pseudomonas amygdali pv. morsprunorum]
MMPPKVVSNLRGSYQSVGNDNLNLCANLFAMGCEAAPKPVTSVASGTPRRLVSLPVPGRSRTNEASPGPHI